MKNDICEYCATEELHRQKMIPCLLDSIARCLRDRVARFVRVDWINIDIDIDRDRMVRVISEE